MLLIWESSQIKADCLVCFGRLLDQTMTDSSLKTLRAPNTANMVDHPAIQYSYVT